MPAHTRIMRILALALLAQISQGLAPRAASTRRRWLAAAPGLLLLRPSQPATAVTPGGEFCICNDKGCFGENCGGLKRPDVKYLGAATESYGAELSGASAALSGSRRGAAPAPAFVADAPESDLERAMREAAGKKSTEPRAHGR